MSQDLGNAAGLGGVLYPNDLRHADEDFFGNDDLFQPDPLANYYVREDLWYGAQTFRSPWWPCAGANTLVGDQGGSVALLYDKNWRVTDPWPNLPGGANGRLAFAGTTRDEYGSPLPFAVVKCYRTSTDEVTGSTVSDGSGNYTVTTPYYPDGHYLVVYKTGTPDTFGTTVNTLIAG